MATKSKYSAEDKKAYANQKRAEQREMLAQAVEKLQSSEGWRQYLDTRARFYNYSFYNTILIALQKPEATQVAGANKWNKEFDRRVMEDQFKTHAIKILAPMIIYLKENGKIVTDEEGKKVIDRVWYKTVEVYDVSQTEGEPLPSVDPEPVTGESHEEYIYRAEQVLQSMGLEVEYGALGSVLGDSPALQLEENKVIINGSLPVNTQVVGAIRALTNRLMYAGDRVKGQKEAVMEESVVYLTCRNVGLDTSGMSVPHIAKWGLEEGEDPKNALKVLKEFATEIDNLTQQVTEAVEEGV